MPEIGEIYIKIKAKTDDLYTEVRKLKSRLPKEVGEASDAAGKRMLGTFKSYTDQVGNAMSIGVTAPLIAAGKGAFDAAVKMERMEASLRSIIGSTSKTTAELSTLRLMSDRTGASYEALVKASAGVITGFKGNTREANFVLDAFARMSSQLGVSKTDFERIAINLTQIGGSAKLSGDELREMSSLLPNMRTLLEKAFGTSASEEIAKFGVSGREALLAVAMGANKIAPATDTVSFKLNQMQNEFFGLKVEAGRAILPIAKDLLQTLVPAIKAASAYMQKMTTEQKENALKWLAVAAAAGPVIKIFTGVASAIKGLISLKSAVVEFWGAKTAAMKMAEVQAMQTGVAVQTGALGAMRFMATLGVAAMAAKAGDSGPEANDSIPGTRRRLFREQINGVLAQPAKSPDHLDRIKEQAYQRFKSFASQYRDQEQLLRDPTWLQQNPDMAGFLARLDSEKATAALGGQGIDKAVAAAMAKARMGPAPKILASGSGSKQNATPSNPFGDFMADASGDVMKARQEALTAELLKAGKYAEAAYTKAGGGAYKAFSDLTKSQKAVFIELGTKLKAEADTAAKEATKELFSKLAGANMKASQDIDKFKTGMVIEAWKGASEKANREIAADRERRAGVDALVGSLQKQLDKELELTTVQQVMSDIQTRGLKLNESEMKQVMELARRKDDLIEIDKRQKSQAEVDRLDAEALNRYSEAMANLSLRYSEMGGGAQNTEFRLRRLAIEFGRGTTEAERYATGLERAKTYMAEQLKLENFAQWTSLFRDVALSLSQPISDALKDLVRLDFPDFLRSTSSMIDQFISEMSQGMIELEIRMQLNRAVNWVVKEIGSSFFGSASSRSIDYSKTGGIDNGVQETYAEAGVTRGVDRVTQNLSINVAGALNRETIQQVQQAAYQGMIEANRSIG